MTENFKDNARLFSSYLLSLSLLAIAAALVYFTIEIASLTKQIPDILVSINNTSDKIEPVVDEVGGIVELIPGIMKQLEETRKLVPPILKEIEQTRKLVPPILKQVELTREQIPAVLNEVGAVRKDIPAMLVSVDKASASVIVMSKQIEATRPLIPEVLKEVETTRNAIPPIMDRADMLIEKARVAGKEASQGAVTGLFKGIITAPFVLVGDVGKRIAGVSEERANEFSKEDFAMIEKISLELLNTGSIGDKKQWKNPESGNSGSVVLSDIYPQSDDSDVSLESDCRTLNIVSYRKQEKVSDIARSMCKNADEKWEFDE